MRTMPAPIAIRIKSISSLKMCLPTASGCHFRQRRPRYVAVFGQLSVKVICLTVRHRTMFPDRTIGPIKITMIIAPQ
jgi:hypothetical protein